MTAALRNFLNAIVPDGAKGKLVFEAANGKRLISDRIGKIRKFLRENDDVRLSLITADGERFGFARAEPIPDYLPPPTFIVGDANVWMLDTVVEADSAYVRAVEAVLIPDFIPIGDIQFVGDEDNYYAIKDMWTCLNALRVTTVEAILEAEREALANGRLIADNEVSATYHPKASAYIDARGRERPIIYNQAADEFAEETGLTVIAHPPHTYDDDFSRGSYLPNRIQVIFANSRKKKFTKKIYIDENGEKKKDDYQYEKQVWTFTVVVNNFEEMAKAFAALLPMQNMCVLRGHCVADSWYLCNRRYLPKEGKPTPPSFCEAPLHWFFADIDNLAMPDGLSYGDPERMARYTRAKLPTVLRKVAMSYQFSSSAAVWTTDKIKVHCAFWLPEPITCWKMKEWAKGTHIKQNNHQYKSIIDDALFHPVQPHYSACPELKGGLEDPLEGRRVGTLDGDPCADIADEVEVASTIVIAKEERRLRNKPIAEPKNKWDRAANELGRGSRGDGNIPKKIWDKIIRDKLMTGEGGERFYGPTLQLVSSAINNGVTDFDKLKSEYVRVLHQKFKTLPLATQHKWAGDLEKHTSDERFNDLIEYCSTQ